MDIVSENGGTLRRTKQTDESCFLYANAPDVWVMTGAWLLIWLGEESLRCSRKTGDEFQRRWTEGYRADAMDQQGGVPWYMPLELGRTSFTEADAFADTRRLDHECPEFDAALLMRQHEFFQSVMPSIEAATGCLGVFSTYLDCSYTADAMRRNTPVWAERFQKEFNPKGLSNTGFPYFGDKMAEAMPRIITEEVKNAVNRVKEAKWRGI